MYLDVECSECVGDVGGTEYCTLRMAHEFEGFLDDLLDPVFEVHGELFGGIDGESLDS